MEELTLLKNKVTGHEYYVDETELENLRKNQLLTRFQIVKKAKQEKAPATVEVTTFIQQKKQKPQQEQKESVKDETETKQPTKTNK